MRSNSHRQFYGTATANRATFARFSKKNDPSGALASASASVSSSWLGVPAGVRSGFICQSSRSIRRPAVVAHSRRMPVATIGDGVKPSLPLMLRPDMPPKCGWRDWSSKPLNSINPSNFVRRFSFGSISKGRHWT